MDKRQEFLLKVYDQMFNDIDRHHKIIWQVVGVLIGSFAIMALVEKEIISMDIAVGIIVLLSMWVIMNIYDSNYWYNRNLVIISNIERQFLIESDLKDIHYYFGEHRPKNAVQTSLKIQMRMIWGLITIVLSYHFYHELVPGLNTDLKWENIRLFKLAPYLTLVLSYLYFVRWIRKKREDNYMEFLQNSPGKKINSSEIEYGDGHGHIISNKEKNQEQEKEE